MSPKPTIGIVELGNINVKCVIFKITQENNTEIWSTSIVPSEGIHNDVIINISSACSAIRKCVSNAESKINISLKKINILFEQPDFLCTRFSKHKKIDGAKIYKDDIDFLLKEAKKQLILNDKKPVAVVKLVKNNAAPISIITLLRDLFLFWFLWLSSWYFINRCIASETPIIINKLKVK